MTLTAAVIAELASDPLHLPPCPCCSFLTPGTEPIIRGPSLLPNRANGSVRLLKCCALSDGPRFDSAADAATWWRHRRAAGPSDPTLRARWALTLERLRQAGYEGIPTQEPARTAGSAQGDGEAQPGEAGQGQLGLCQAMAPGEAVEAGALHAPLSGQAQGAPLCVRGSSIYPNHERGSSGDRCRFCGWTFPRLSDLNL